MKIMRVLGIVQNQVEELKFREVRIKAGNLCRFVDKERRIIKIEHIPVGVLALSDKSP